ncbi:MAG: AbrB/MazE/SpoVT family DNA-binding domain-containing protein [Candidatus Competibacteraceae bacterium]
MATTLTSKGQVTIPKFIRELLGLQAGSAVDFQVTEEGQVLVVPADCNRFIKPAVSRFSTLRGIATVKMTTDEIMALTRGEN